MFAILALKGKNSHLDLSMYKVFERKIFKTMVLLISCLIISWLSLLFFQVFGEYAFLIMITITFAALISRVKPKFGSKKDK